jgi:hypothetical protein
MSALVKSGDKPGDTSCANTPFQNPAVGRFPLIAADARSAQVDPSGGHQASAGELKTVSVAVATAIDTVQRSIIGSGSSSSLHGGSFQTQYDSSWTTTLSDCAFASDGNGYLGIGQFADGRFDGQWQRDWRRYAAYLRLLVCARTGERAFYYRQSCWQKSSGARAEYMIQRLNASKSLFRGISTILRVTMMENS